MGLEESKLGIVADDYVQRSLAQPNTSKSNGYDEIPARVLKDGSPMTSTPMAYIFNLSMKKSSVPDNFKVACVLPL